MPPSKKPKQPSDDQQVVGAAPTPTTKRNFAYIRPDTFKRGDTIVQAPTYITSQGSPVKHSASNPVTGEGQTRAVVDRALKDELGGARILADDLIDQMFGSLISLKLAKRVLEGLLQAEKVTVCDSRGESPADTTPALEDAYARARAHACKHDKVDVVKTPKKDKSTEVVWDWKWVGYPTATIVESDIVDYFNAVIDAALALPCLADLRQRQAQYRFAVPYDMKHAFPLAFGPHDEDMRPDFVVLPLRVLHVEQPATPEYRTDEKHSNFTMIRLSGECKTSDHNAGATQVQRYMRGTRRSQPWQRFITAMNVTKQSIGFMRGEGTGIERVCLELKHGRSSLEFVRLLLGIALADEETFGKSCHFELAEEEQVLQSSSVEPEGAPPANATSMLASSEVPSEVPSDGRRQSARLREKRSNRSQGSGVSQPEAQESFESGTGSFEDGPPSGPQTRSSQSLQVPNVAESSTSSPASRSSEKRKRDDDDNDEYVDPATAPRPKKKPIKEVVYTVRAPITAFGYKVVGILFNAASIRGRGTVVWVVQADKVVALKLSWQDVARKERRDKVLEILRNDKHHENILYPTALEKGEDSTLRTIRAFTSDEVEGWAAQHGVEDRVLEVHVIDLGRPVMFFWSVQDFVMGLRGALLGQVPIPFFSSRELTVHQGHQYLVQIGILHRDISENNILLALIPGLIRGYITDFDMAIPYPKTVPQQQPLDLVKFALRKPSDALDSLSSGGPFKAERTGTTPFMSINVLARQGHTHYDDVESFLYVLVLFFMTYKHPLSAVDLSSAETQNYTQNVTNSRRSHITDWPPLFQRWNSPHAAGWKWEFFAFDAHAMVFADTVRKHWSDDIAVTSIVDLLDSCRELFKKDPKRHVSHQQFIALLDEWLGRYPVPPPGYNSCPFQDEQQNRLV
ncbi:hypothetical protein F5I97DRAFT_1964097 [Phlebopus sp. FC_14]|nr:hypothetical protein F5I97DRAFT_1964097 [Phlebopus sp. FC_14]